MDFFCFVFGGVGVVSKARPVGSSNNNKVDMYRHILLWHIFLAFFRYGPVGILFFVSFFNCVEVHKLWLFQIV